MNYECETFGEVVAVTTYKTQLTGTTPYVNYQFRVRANNQQGAGEWSMTHGDLGPSADIQFNFNKATGGTEKNFAEGTYNGEPGTWRTHTFTGPGTFTVESQPRDFKLLLVGGGVSGGQGSWDWSGAGGRGGRLLETTGKLSLGGNSVAIGGNSDKPSTVGTFSSVTGNTGGGGGGPASGPNGYTKGGNGGTGRSSTISGSTVWYVGGGGAGGPKHKDNSSGDWNWGGDGGSGGNRGGGGGSRGTGSGANANGWNVGNGGSGGANTGGGGGGGGEREGSHQGGAGGGGGGTGIVIIAYRTG